MSQAELPKAAGADLSTVPTSSNGRTATHLETSKPPTSPSTTVPTSTTIPAPTPKRSLLRKLLGILLPCVPDASALNEAEHRNDKVHNLTPKVIPKRVEEEKVPFANGDTPHSDNETHTPGLPPSTDSHTVSPPEEVVVPPIPTTPQLLPTEETAGLTSGAVQPPGSKLDDAPPEKPVSPPVNTEGEESEETTYSEEELDEQDEEDRLILNGGIGIPIGPDGVPKPLLPPISPQHVGRKCLVLDLDETLVHSSFKSISQADYVVPVEIEYHWHNVYVIKRPGVDNFLKKMGEIYEIVVFTASLSKYADPVLDKLDIHQVVSHRLFRESCYNHKGNYVKDLSQLGRPISDTIILDNSPASYIFHPNNAVPVSSWFNDPHDTELTDLIAFLGDLSPVDDVRGILDGAR